MGVTRSLSVCPCLAVPLVARVRICSMAAKDGKEVSVQLGATIEVIRWVKTLQIRNSNYPEQKQETIQEKEIISG